MGTLERLIKNPVLSGNAAEIVSIFFTTNAGGSTTIGIYYS
jgi:hypothetical protein